MKRFFPKRLADYLRRKEGTFEGLFVSLALGAVVALTVFPLVVALVLLILIPIGYLLQLIWHGVVGLVVWLFFLFKDYPTLLIPVVIAGIALISIGTKIDQ